MSLQNKLFLSLLAIALLGGCDLVGLTLFRRELRDNPPRYIRDDMGQVVHLRFSVPVLTEEALTSSGIPLERRDASTFVANYRLTVLGCPEIPFQMIFSFRDSKLEDAQMPAFLPELVGEKNVRALLRLATGARMPADAFADIPAEQAEILVQQYCNRSVGLGLAFTVRLRPEQPGGRNISITFGRADSRSPFKDMTLSFKRQSAARPG